MLKKMRIWTQKSALIQPRTNLGKSDGSWLAWADYVATWRLAPLLEDSQEAGRTTRFVPPAADQGDERMPLRGRD